MKIPINDIKTAFIFNSASPLGEAVANEFLKRGFAVIAGLDTPYGETADRLRENGARVEAVVLHQEDRVGERRIGELARGADVAVMTDMTSAMPRVVSALENAAPGRCLFVSANDVGINPGNTRFSGYASAEARVMASRLSWTILRPTMTYGHPDDGNLSVLAQRMKYGRKTQAPAVEALAYQPIHFEDVARAAAELAIWADGAGRTIPIGGPEKISLPSLCEAVADAVEAKARPQLISMARLRLKAKAARLFNLHGPAGMTRSGHLEKPRAAFIPDDVPAAARPQIGLKSGLERLAQDLSRLDGTREGAQLAANHTPELPL